MQNKNTPIRCNWAVNDQLLINYHDKEWGVPQHDDNRLFEMFSLDVFQAGLSWLTILKKRQAFRDAFCQFDIQKIAQFDENRTNQLLQNQHIVRNRKKIEAVIHNARQCLEIINNFGSFDSYIWQFTDGQTIINHYTSFHDIPARSDISVKMSKVLKKQGFRFAGPVICYAFMQSVGMVNDHTVSCFRYEEVRA